MKRHVHLYEQGIYVKDGTPMIVLDRVLRVGIHTRQMGRNWYNVNTSYDDIIVAEQLNFEADAVFYHHCMFLAYMSEEDFMNTP